MIDVLDDIDFCFFQEDEIFFFVLFAVIFESAESGAILTALPETIPFGESKAIIFIISKLFGYFKQMLEEH